MSDPALYADGLTYAWVIDVDHFDEPDSGKSDVGVSGPRDAPDALLARLAAGEGRPFQMWDEDDERHSDGRIVFGDGSENEGETETHFAPVLDFGMGNSGATEIKYLVDGQWEAL